MSRVILQPAGDPHARKHYADTIERPVVQDRLGRFLSPEDMEAIRGLYGSALVPTWGVTPGGRDVNVKKWERVSPGDVVLMARDSAIFASSVVVHKTHNAELALDLWGRDDAGATWEYLYFLTDVRPQSLHNDQLNTVLGYADGARVQGFNVLDAAKSERLLRALGLPIGSSDHPQWDFEPGDRVLRKALHQEFGGRGQGGIGPSTKSPNVFLFTDPETGRQHGYFDGWDQEGVYHYYGEGQRGDQRMMSGNAAILDPPAGRPSVAAVRGIAFRGRVHGGVRT